MKRGVARAMVCVVTVATLLTGCSEKRVTGVSGLDPVGVVPSGSGPAIAPGPTSESTSPATSTTMTTSTKNPGGGHQPQSGTSSGPSSPGSPPGRPSKIGGVHSFTLPSDYGVTVDNFCYWAKNHDGSESLYAGYGFHYKGFQEPKRLNFVAQDNFGHNNYSYIGSSWFNDGLYSNDEGVTVDGYTFSGQRVVLNVYLIPAINNLIDNNAANNRAEVTIYVPSGPAPASGTQAVRVNCVVDYGSTFN
jgi:hypothetical protein